MSVNKDNGTDTIKDNSKEKTTTVDGVNTEDVSKIKSFLNRHTTTLVVVLTVFISHMIGLPSFILFTVLYFLFESFIQSIIKQFKESNSQTTVTA